MNSKDLPKLSEDIIKQIKDFKNNALTAEQASFVEKLIPNKELRDRYINCGICRECSQLNTGKIYWCQPCNSKRLQQDFNKWASGNKEIDECIRNSQLNATGFSEMLELVPYDKFENIEYLSEGGFGTVYKAKWNDGFIRSWNFDKNEWDRNNAFTKTFVLKCLNNSQNLTRDFLQEIINHKKLWGPIVKCYGITQDPKTKNFMMIMEYIKNGDLSRYLKNNYKKLKLEVKLSLISNIITGLNDIHCKGLIHKDLHSGNILCVGGQLCYISDLGLCRPVNEEDDEKGIHGVLPYVAPEVLKGKKYSQAADIYSFGILACEILSESPPYHDMPHNKFIALKICQGLRPKIDIKIPFLLKELIDQCLDADPLKRPTAEKLFNIISEGWMIEIYNNPELEIYQQLEEAENFNNSTSSNSSFPVAHLQAIYHSRLLDYNNLPKPQNSKEINDQFYNSDSLLELQINDDVSLLL